MLLPDSPDLQNMLDMLGFRIEDAVGIGTTSIILPKGDRVLRLTIDDMSHAFLIAANGRPGLASPKVFQDHGVVGHYEDDGEDCDFELLECERLDDLEKWPAQLQLVQEWDFILLERIDELPPFRSEVSVNQLRTAAQQDGAQLGLSQSLIDTHMFAADLAERMHYDLDFDLNITNYMVRPHTGEILLTDPVHN